MLGRFLPRDEQFFDLFNQLADHLVTSAKLLNDLFAADPKRAAEYCKAIKDVEHKADLLTASIIQRIDKSFVTPFDREDIHNVTTSLDDVIDLIDGTARRYDMFHIEDHREPAKRLANIIVRASGEIKEAVAGIKNPKVVRPKVAAIKQLEEEADAVYQEAVGALFAGNPAPLDVIKWKEMYDTLERTTDSCMGVAQALQSLSLKHA
jgi:predicted phosphate transport protein (TIGR00153 family)